MASLDSLFISIMTALMGIGVGVLADLTSPVKALIIMQLFQAIPILLYWRLWRQSTAKIN